MEEFPPLYVVCLFFLFFFHFTHSFSMYLWLLRGCVYVHDQGKNLDLNAPYSTNREASVMQVVSSLSCNITVI